MAPFRPIVIAIVFISLAPFRSDSSPANPPTGSPPLILPAPLSLDKTACAEGPILVTLRFEHREELPFKVDTGSSITILDESLTPGLGRRLGKSQIPFPFESGAVAEGTYQMPKLYAGETQLFADPKVYVAKLPVSAAHPYKGILGMDCLGHYCVQFDFLVGKMTFLDPYHLDTRDLGTPVAIASEKGGRTFFDADLFGEGKMRFLLDTGFCGPFDAMLAPKLLEHLTRKNRTIGPDLYMRLADGRAASGNIFPSLKIGGQTYTDLRVSAVDLRPRRDKGILGMHFLARHKITLNFPKRTFYLKPTSSAPLAQPKSN